jgi:rhodanese-related sulfurtransferase
MSGEKISQTELKALLVSGSVFVLDIRSLEEFEKGHLPGALHRPVDTRPGAIKDLAKEGPVVTICNKGGGRSERAAHILRDAGWKGARWLEGGYLGWVEAGVGLRAVSWTAR